MYEALHGLITIWQPLNLVFLISGVIIGLTFGVIPGLQNVTALAIILPFTYGLASTHAFILMVAIYASGVFCGAITAILYGIPGAPENAPTVYDGFALTKKGQAAKALGTVIICSAVGGLISAVIFILLARQIAVITLAFGPPEYFSLIFFAICIVCLMGESLVKSAISAFLGLLFGTVGLSQITGQSRLTFGWEFLLSGFNFVAIIVGVFAIAELLDRAEFESAHPDRTKVQPQKVSTRFPSLREFFGLHRIVLRSSILGTIIGTIPALGAVVASFLSYDVERRISKHPERFGTGILEGIAAPETANNASTGGAMIPLMTLGIPGSSSTVIMLAAFLIYGLQPGVGLFRDYGDLVRLIYASLIMTNILMIFGGLVMVRLIARLAYLRLYLLAPLILTLCTIGAFTVRYNMLDLWAMFGFGCLGYLLTRNAFSVPLFVFGFILGPLAENGFLRSMILFDNNPALFFARPFCAIFLGTSFLGLGWTLLRRTAIYAQIRELSSNVRKEK